MYSADTLTGFDPTQQLSEMDEMRAMMAMQRMTVDYLGGLVVDHDSMRAENETLRRQATVDKLTGLSNEHKFAETYRGLVSAHPEDRDIETTPAFLSPHTAIFIDVDNFKEVNERFLHKGGNEALVAIAGVVKRVVHRKRDIAARIGGDEMAVILARTKVDRGLVVAEDIRSGIEALRVGRQRFRVTASIGVAGLRHAETWEEGLQPADTAAFASKDRGRNRVTLYDPSLPTRAQAA